MRKNGRKVMALLLAAVLAACACAALADGGWTCPNCGRENTDEMNFCGGCRTPRPEAVPPAASAGFNAWVCAGCGKTCPDEDTFCTNCGGDPLPGVRAVLLREPTLQEVSVQPCEVVRYTLTLAADGEPNLLDFTAPTEGVYYFWIEDQRADFRARMYLRDDKDKEVGGGDFPANKPTMYTVLTAGGRYTIDVRKFDGTPDCTLCIGIPRDPEPIPEASLIRDSLVYHSQDNTYLLTASVSGRYRVDMYESREDNEPNIIIEDDLGHVVRESSYGVAMGRGVSADLEAGKTYIIHVRQWDGTGEYVLRIGTPHAPVDITGAAAFGGSAWYETQYDEFLYTAPKNGEYRLGFTMTRDSDRFTLEVEDDLGHSVKEADNLNKGMGIRTELEAGRRYTFRVKQSSGTGPYTVTIEEP